MVNQGTTQVNNVSHLQFVFETINNCYKRYNIIVRTRNLGEDVMDLYIEVVFCGNIMARILDQELDCSRMALKIMKACNA
jgi:hypothetical protein